MNDLFSTFSLSIILLSLRTSRVCTYVCTGQEGAPGKNVVNIYVTNTSIQSTNFVNDLFSTFSLSILLLSLRISRVRTYVCTGQEGAPDESVHTSTHQTPQYIKAVNELSFSTL